MGHTKIIKGDLDSPHREVSIGGLGVVIALLVRWQTDLSCVSTGGAIQLYRYICWQHNSLQLLLQLSASRAFPAPVNASVVDISPATGSPAASDVDIVLVTVVIFSDVASVTNPGWCQCHC